MNKKTLSTQHKTFTKQAATSSLVALALTIAGCGGGGGGSTPAPTPTPTPSPAPAPAPAPTPTPTPLTQDQAFEQYLTALTTRVIVPGYENFQSRAQALMNTTTTECQNAGSTSDANDFSTIQTSWREASQAWQAVAWLGQGPAGENSNRFKIQSWPDERGNVARGVAALEANPETVTATIVANTIASAQGLTAMELILYRAQTTPVDAVAEAKECEVLTAIATNIHNLSVSFSSAWQANDGIRQQLVSGSGQYTSRKDSVEELVSNWLEYFEVVKDDKLIDGITNTARAENALSDQTTFNLRTNIDSFIKVFNADSDFGLDDVLIRAHEQNNIATQINDSFATVTTAGNALRDSFQAEAGSVQGQARIRALSDAMDVSRDLVRTNMVQALDLNLGFNGNDGD